MNEARESLSQFEAECREELELLKGDLDAATAAGDQDRAERLRELVSKVSEELLSFTAELEQL